MSRITPGIAPRLEFHVLNADGTAKTDLAYTDFTTAKYVLITAGVAGAASSDIGTLSAGTPASAKATGTFGAIVAADGYYFLDYPVGAAPSTADTVVRVELELTDGTLIVISTYHVIDYEVSTRATQTSVDTIDGIVDVILLDTDELQTNQGSWLTATGFSTHSASDVWAVGTRSLTTFGSLVTDIVTAVWGAGARTLTAISDSSGVTTLLTRITALLETKAEADTRQTAILDAISAIESGELTGDYTLTVTVTDADTDDPIEGAIVTIYRTGERGASPTDASGEAELAIGAYTWSWIVTASGYTGQSGSKVITGHDTLTVELDSIIITVPDNPSKAALQILCVDEDGEPEVGVVVDVRIVKVPVSVTDVAFSGVKQSDTSDANGLVNFEVYKGGTYQIKRGLADEWDTITIGSADTQSIASFIGS